MKDKQKSDMSRSQLGMRFSPNIWCSLLLLCLCLLWASCGCEPLKLPMDTSFKKEAFNDFSSQEVTWKNPGKINIFVDISYSNRGFIKPDNSDFLRCIRDLCAILNPNITINFFRFGNDITLVGSRIPGKKNELRISEVLNKLGDISTFNDKQTRFDILFDFLDKNKNQNDLNLIFTDGIHSENKNTENIYVELANYIRKYVSEKKRNNLFSILGSRGKYSGIYYTESSCPDINNFNGLRPFYCFIFGSRAHVEFIKTHLLEYWQNHFLLYPASVKKILVDKTKTNVGFDDHLIDKGAVVLNKVKDTDVYSIPLTLKSTDFGFWNLETFTTTINMKIVEIYPPGCKKGKDGSDVKVDVIKKISGINHSVSVLSFNGKNELAITIKFKPVEDKGLCIYKLTFTPGVPKWIGEWSTASDCTVEDAQKTYGLENFTRNLLTVTSDSQFEFVNLYFVESRR